MARIIPDPASLVGKKIALGSGKALYEWGYGVRVIEVTRVTKTKLVYGAVTGPLCKYIKLDSHEWTDDESIVAETERRLHEKQQQFRRQEQERRERQATPKWQLANRVSAFFYRSTDDLFETMNEDELRDIELVINRFEKRVGAE